MSATILPRRRPTGQRLVYRLRCCGNSWQVNCRCGGGPGAAHLESCPTCDVALELSDDDAARDFLAEHRRVAARRFRRRRRRRQSSTKSAGGCTCWAGFTSKPPAGDERARPSRCQATSRKRPGNGSRRSEPPPTPSVGKFEIIELLGGGGFGMVYLARDRTLNRQVARKLARASVLADPDLKSRFVREAEMLAAQLEHPGIVPVHEAGEHEGTCYLAVGYCAGPRSKRGFAVCRRESIRNWRPAWRWHWPKPLSMPTRTASCTATSSPAIFCSTRPRPPTAHRSLPFTPRLTDFGLAKITEQTGDNTISGVVLGTLHYMSTEQAAGLAERIGPPTDVYSLGAVLYEMLVGRPPLKGKTAIDTLRRVLVEEPVWPRHVTKGVPDDLDAIVMRCLDKSPTRRYATAADLAADLRRFLLGQPTVARPLTLPQPSAG